MLKYQWKIRQLLKLAMISTDYISTEQFVHAFARDGHFYIKVSFDKQGVK